MRSSCAGSCPRPRRGRSTDRRSRPRTPKPADDLRFRAQTLAIDERRDLSAGLEVFRDDLLVLDLYSEGLLEKSDQLEDPGRIHQTGIEEGVVRRDGLAEGARDVVPNLVDRCHAHVNKGETGAPATSEPVQENRAARPALRVEPVAFRDPQRARAARAESSMTLFCWGSDPNCQSSIPSSRRSMSTRS